LDKIEAAMPIAESFQTSCGRLLEWLDKVVPVVESTKVDNSTESEVSHRINFPSSISACLLPICILFSFLCYSAVE